METPNASLPFLPGEEFKYIFALPRYKQVTLIGERARALGLAVGEEALDKALNELEYAIHVTREAIFCEAIAQNRLTSQTQTATTLEDLI